MLVYMSNALPKYTFLDQTFSSLGKPFSGGVRAFNWGSKCTKRTVLSAARYRVSHFDTSSPQSLPSVSELNTLQRGSSLFCDFLVYH